MERAAQDWPLLRSDNHQPDSESDGVPKGGANFDPERAGSGQEEGRGRGQYSYSRQHSGYHRGGTHIARPEITSSGTRKGSAEIIMGRNDECER